MRSQAEEEEGHQVLTATTSCNRLKNLNLRIIFISFCCVSSTAVLWRVRWLPPPLCSGPSPETPLLSLLLCPPSDCNWSFSRLHKISILPAIWMPADKIERCRTNLGRDFWPGGRQHITDFAHSVSHSHQQLFAHTDLHLLMLVQLASPHLLPVELLLLLLLQHVFSNQPVCLDLLQVFPLLEFLYIWILRTLLEPTECVHMMCACGHKYNEQYYIIY